VRVEPADCCAVRLAKATQGAQCCRAAIAGENEGTLFRVDSRLNEPCNLMLQCHQGVPFRVESSLDTNRFVADLVATLCETPQQIALQHERWPVSHTGVKLSGIVRRLNEESPHGRDYRVGAA